MTTMKKTLYIICMVLAVTFAACHKDANVVDSSTPDRAVAFSAESIAPLTRVSGSEWEAGDAIGITMVDAGDYTIYYDNVKYIAAEGGTSVSFTADSEVIYYREDDSKVCFMAFYPYQESWSYATFDMVFDISAQDGSAEAQSKVDLLVSSADTDQSSGECKLYFEHFLSKVQVTVSNRDERVSVFEDLTSLTASMDSYYTQFNISDQEKVANSEAKELKMVKTMDDDNTAIFTVIIQPGAVNEEIIFTNGIYHYTAKLEIEQAEMGMQYNFTATVGDQGIELVELTNDGVTDWDAQGESVLSTDIEVVDGVYQIYTAKGLEMFADWVNGGSTSIDGKLMNDIDLGGSEENQWSAIGWYESSSNYCGYSGTFDGGGFKVSGLYIDKPSSDYQGLFGYTRGATICNLGVGGSVTGYSYVGGVVGYNYYESSSHSSIINCYNTAAVSGSSNCGGIVGCSRASSASLSEIINCYNTGTVKGTSYIGGVVGYSYYNEVINCYNTGTVNASNRDSYVGGIMGASSNSKVINCYNTGAVSGATNYIGGVIGQNNTSSEVNNCYNTGTVSGSSNYIGGVAGYNYSNCTITNCYFDSSVYSGSAVGVDNNSSATTATGYSTGYMQSDSFAKLLNNGAYIYNEGSLEIEACAWAAVSEDYPVFDLESEPAYVDIYKCTSFGSGSESDPYLIYTNAQLRDLSTNVCAGESYSDKCFKMMCDIDLGGESSEFTAIGTHESAPFSGTFDGGDYSITGLYIGAGITGQGLFGCVKTGTVKNLKVGGSVSNANYHTGLIAGSGINATFISCSTLEGSTVTCTLNNNTAGIVGYVESSSFEDCHNNATVNGRKHVAGIVGYCSKESSTFINCSNTGVIYSGYTGLAGGVVATIYNATVINCYNTGSVTATSTYAGGVVAYADSSSSVINCYNSGAVSGSSYVGGVVGQNNSGTVTSCYYDSTIYTGSGIGSGSGNVIGCSTSLMQSSYFVRLLNNNAYTYNNETSPTTKACAWVAVSGGYPTLDADGTPSYNAFTATEFGSGSESDPYLIVVGEQLRDLSTNINSDSEVYFKMMFDIDLGGESNAFTPIGKSTTHFKGIFDGGGHKISGLHVNSTSSSYKGLFGYIENATIKNLGVSGSVTSSGNYTGGIVGYASGSNIESCYSTVTVVSSEFWVGGIVGYIKTNSTVKNCYNTGSVSGTSANSAYVGGIAGYAYDYSSVSYCYNTGAISSVDSSVGGITGRIVYSDVNYCYSTGSAVGSKYVGGIVGYSGGGSVSNCKFDSSVYSGSVLGDYDSSTTTSNNSSSSTLTTTMTNGTFSSILGSDYWKEDTDKINSGYPILIWQ